LNPPLPSLCMELSKPPPLFFLKPLKPPPCYCVFNPKSIWNEAPLCFTLNQSKNAHFLLFTNTLSQPQLGACNQGKGLQRCEPRGKPGNHISCSWECRRM
jgi:hypothetical protein